MQMTSKHHPIPHKPPQHPTSCFLEPNQNTTQNNPTTKMAASKIPTIRPHQPAQSVPVPNYEITSRLCPTCSILLSSDSSNLLGTHQPNLDSQNDARKTHNGGISLSRKHQNTRTPNAKTSHFPKQIPSNVLQLCPNKHVQSRPYHHPT